MLQIGGREGMSSGKFSLSTNNCSSSSLPYLNSANLNFFAKLAVGVVGVCKGLVGEGGPALEPPPWLDSVLSLHTYTQSLMAAALFWVHNKSGGHLLELFFLKFHLPFRTKVHCICHCNCQFFKNHVNKASQALAKKQKRKQTKGQN